jgi:hypothetical protein
LLFLAVLIGGAAIWAWSIGDETVKETEFTESGGEPIRFPEPDPSAPTTSAHGRVELDLAHGGFRILAGLPGEPTEVVARYDSKMYRLEESLDTSRTPWVYTVRFRRKTPVLVALFRGMRGGEEPRVDVFLSPDEPLELIASVKQGGIEAELGGLWLTKADLDFKQGGGEIVFDEPLRAPMDEFHLTSDMGGFEVHGLAHASPRRLDVKCRMGGAELDLDGDWAQDVDVTIDVTMGGVEVDLPADVRAIGLDGVEGGSRVSRGDPEIPERTMRFDVNARMGGIEVSR